MTIKSRTYGISNANNIRRLFNGYTPDVVGATQFEIWLEHPKTKQKVLLLRRNSKISPWRPNPNLSSEVFELVEDLLIEARRAAPVGMKYISQDKLREHLMQSFRTMGLFDRYSSF